MKIYLLVEILLLIIYILLRLNITNITIISVIKFLPIFINFIFCLYRKIDRKLLFALFFTLLADFNFMFPFNNCLGVAFFVLVQVIYCIYLTNKYYLLILLSLINIIFVLIFDRKILIIETVIYALLIISNIIRIFFLSKKSNNLKIFFYSILLLLCCDLSILIKQKFTIGIDLEVLFDILEWIFYIPSQIFLVLYSNKNKT